MTRTGHLIGSGHALFILPDNKFINATKPLTPISKPIKEAANK